MVDSRRRTPRGTIVWCVGLAASLLAAFVALVLGPPWVKVWWTGLLPDTRRTISVTFLLSFLVGYGIALAFGLIGGGVAAWLLVRGRRAGVRRPVSAKVLLLSVATVFSLATLEAASWGLAVWNRLPPAPPPLPPPVPEGRAKDELVMLVIGESSAEGQPFHPWYSMGHVVAREIERANGGRKVRIIMAASGGVPLARAEYAVGHQSERPDVVVLVSGHNEFQARWGWSRAVNYYKDDVIERPRVGLTDRVGEWTPFTRMIRDEVERQAIDLPPPPREVRDVVDRPVTMPEDRAAIARLFAIELDVIATWCDKAGAVPIFVLPAGNDVGFDPDRSLLDPSTKKADREAFGREFLAIRDRESADPEAAIAAYRLLIERQPLFAEAHFCLARLLQAKGAIDEARDHYTLARDLDGLPMRCPSEFQNAYRLIAAKHPNVILVDAQARLQELSPTKLLDDNVFHDGQHPTFLAYLALAEDALAQMRSRRLFGLDRAILGPLDPDELAAYFKLDLERWATVCTRSAGFWERLSVPRYDGSARRKRAERMHLAAEAIRNGKTPEETGVPGLGVHPAGFGASRGEAGRSATGSAIISPQPGDVASGAGSAVRTEVPGPAIRSPGPVPPAGSPR